jgi:hypothetical protein
VPVNTASIPESPTTKTKKLLAILSKVEKLKAKTPPPAPAPPAAHAPMTALVLGIAEWDSYDEVPSEPLDISDLFTTSPDSYEERPLRGLLSVTSLSILPNPLAN